MKNLDETELTWLGYAAKGEYELYVGKGESKEELKTAFRSVKVRA